MKKRFSIILTVLLIPAFLAACGDDATIVNHNMTKAADNFEIMRRVILYNAIRGENIMITEGRCTVDAGQLRTSVTCKVGPDNYIRNFYGNADNTLYVVEQMETVAVNPYHYRRTFKPQSILPDIDLRADGKAFINAIIPDNND